jgi:hypothetical protein
MRHLTETRAVARVIVRSLARSCGKLGPRAEADSRFRLADLEHDLDEVLFVD